MAAGQSARVARSSAFLSKKELDTRATNPNAGALLGRQRCSGVGAYRRFPNWQGWGNSALVRMLRVEMHLARVVAG